VSNRLGEELRRLLDGGSLDQTADRLRERLEKAPDSVALRQRLAETLRQLGRLDEAAEHYRYLRKQRPLDPGIQRLAAICDGRRPPAPQPTPMPFHLVKDFLPEPLLEQLLAHVSAKADKFESTAVRSDSGDQAEDLEERRSASLGELGEAGDCVRTLVDAAAADFTSYLGLEKFPYEIMSCKITTYGDGHFFRLHQDRATGIAASRRFGFIYYFNFEPKRFSGGELLLYDRDPDTLYPTATFTTIHPVCNTLAIIPANCWHEVLPIACDDEFLAGRFTLSGWVHDQRLLELQ
jgi:Rps23 Pro-64 3,4-dihydroxylase Tpa1-like proline 4-hydroxylase